MYECVTLITFSQENVSWWCTLYGCVNLVCILVSRSIFSTQGVWLSNVMYNVYMDKSQSNVDLQNKFWIRVSQWVKKVLLQISTHTTLSSLNNWLNSMSSYDSQSKFKLVNSRGTYHVVRKITNVTYAIQISNASSLKFSNEDNLIYKH